MQTSVWPILLSVREKIRAWDRPLELCVFSLDKDRPIYLDSLPQEPGPWIYVLFEPRQMVSVRQDDSVCYAAGLLDYRWDQPGSMATSTLDFLERYLPYCFFARFARLLGRPITVGHFAQSLDGRIATGSGDSRWIGNDANLEHAHRMRALCDGILIGKNTLRLDQPQLTVRRVEGPNPVRIVLGSQITDCGSLLRAATSRIIVFQKESTKLVDEHIEQIIHTCETNIPSEVVLDALFRRRIYSVLIEGGAKTTSAFIREENLDVLQLHIAPILIGSGRSSIQLPEILRIDHAVEFSHFHFHRIANTYMFTGQLHSGHESNLLR